MDTRDPYRDLPRLSDVIHDADKVIGRIRNDGGWDRRYRVTNDPSQAHNGGWPEVLFGCLLMALMGVAFWLWMAIAAAAQ